MVSLLNDTRPPVFCPGCSHDKITHTLDKAFHNMGLTGEKIVMVSDIFSGQAHFLKGLVEGMGNFIV